MVTISSGGLGGLGGGMDILKRLKMMGGGGGGGLGDILKATSAAPASAPAAAPVPMEPPQSVTAPAPAPMTVTDALPEGSGMGLVPTMSQTPEMFKRLNNPSIGERIGDFMQSDRGRGALLRSGAATMQGGLGAGVAAGAAYYDDQKELENKQMNWVSEMGLKTRAQDIDQQQVDQTGAYQAGTLDNNATNNAIQAARNRDMARNEQFDNQFNVVEEEGRNVRFDRGDRTQQRGQDITVRGQDVSMRNTDVNADTAIRGQDNTRYIADENRAYQYGDRGTTTVGVGKRSNVTSTRVNPSYDQEIRYDAEGNPYRLDPFTGKPVRARGQ